MLFRRNAFSLLLEIQLFVKSKFLWVWVIFHFFIRHRNEMPLNHVSLDRNVSDEFVECSSTLSCVHLNCCSAAHKTAAQHKHSLGGTFSCCPFGWNITQRWAVHGCGVVKEVQFNQNTQIGEKRWKQRSWKEESPRTYILSLLDTLKLKNQPNERLKKAFYFS